MKELGDSGRASEVRDRACVTERVSDTERSQTILSGASRVDNQIYWAKFYLAKTGYVDSSQRGVWTLTEKGRALTELTPQQALQIFNEAQGVIRGGAKQDITQTDAPAEITLNEDASEGYRTELKRILLTLPPEGFERLCQRVLRESGFEQVVVTGKSGDGGIDGRGVLLVNPFVSFRVMFQCKRYKDTVSSGVVRDFRGAMTTSIDKGIIITTGSFTSDAQKEALHDGKIAIELVDGEALIKMLETLELGLKPRKTFDVDAQFFAEFQ